MTHPFRPIDSFKSPRFAQIPTFMRLPHHRTAADLDVALVGIPYDGGTSYRAGARFGPREIRVQSAMIRPIPPAPAVPGNRQGHQSVPQIRTRASLLTPLRQLCVRPGKHLLACAREVRRGGRARSGRRPGGRGPRGETGACRRPRDKDRPDPFSACCAPSVVNAVEVAREAGGRAGKPEAAARARGGGQPPAVARARAGRGERASRAS